MDKNSKNDPRSVWQGQPVERDRMTPQDLQKRSNQMRKETRRSLLASAAIVLWIALLFVWKFKFERNLRYDAGLLAAIVWALASTVWFRGRIWPPAPPAEAVSASGVDFYRSEVLERRAHLRTTWAWLGPPYLALGLFVFRIVTKAFGENVPLRTLAPFLALTAIWAGALVIQTRSKLQKLDEELRDLDSMR